MSAFSAPASAATNDWIGKGAVAQFYITTNAGARTHIINAVLMMDNNGKDGKLYVSVVHFTGAVSTATGPVECKWNMNHISVEASLTFDNPTGTNFEGTHIIVIEWQTTGAASNGLQTISTAYGMTTVVDGALKTGTAQMILDPGANLGYQHQEGYPSNWAAIVHGDVTVNSQ